MKKAKARIIRRHVRRSVCQTSQPVDLPGTPEGDKPDVARLSRLEADSRSGRDGQMFPPGGPAVELERLVDLKEVSMRPDLDGTVSRVLY